MLEWFRRTKFMNKSQPHPGKPKNNTSYFYFRTGDYPVTHTHKFYPPTETVEDFWEFIYVTAGEYVHKINGKTRLLKEGSLCILRPDDVHSTHEKTRGSTYITFCVTHEYFSMFLNVLGEGFIEKLLSPPFIETHTDAAKIKYFNAILRNYFAFSKNDYRDKTTCTKFLLAFTAEAVDYASKEETHAVYSAGVEAFIKLLSDPENLALPLCDLIAATNYSYSHLNSIFKKEVGVTPSDYLKEKRLSYAKRMLVSTTYKHEAIAEKVGFATHSRFCVFFKEKTGLTPSQYAAKNRVSPF